MLTTQRKRDPSSAYGAGQSSAALVAPDNAPTPSRSHWYDSPLPLAATSKRADVPSSTVTSDGSDVTVGASCRTVRRAAVLRTVPEPLRTSASNDAPSSDNVVVASVSVGLVASGTSTPSRNQRYLRKAPVAATSKVADAPSSTVRSVGPAVISGGA